ncbi:MAG TPA: hypothetical protein VNS53_07475 [Sphingomicrobium sp.]|jgi:hypothetical protein|nr:hypothetical protein [Sphingomicrobium sp.]
MKRRIVLATVLALAACGRPDPVADDANNVDALPTVNTPTPSPTGAPPANAAASTAAPAPAAGIPAALQGRWGLTPVDCTSTLGDAKGLLIVSSDELRFYESRAVPSPGLMTSADSVSGNFAFSGEGQAWEKYETLELQKDKLIRTERDPVASFSYVRCE